MIEYPGDVARLGRTIQHPTIWIDGTPVSSATTFSREDTKLVKGFAILLMLYHHLFAFSDRIQDGNSYTPLLTFTSVNSAELVGLFGKMCVALFLFLGGYGTWMSYQAKRARLAAGGNFDEVQTNRLLSDFTLAKVKGLYIPYLKVFAIVVPISLVLGDPRVQASLSALFWNMTGLKITYNGEWWFFTDYLILLLAFPLITRFFDRRRGTFTVDLLAICVWNAAAMWLIPELAHLDWAADFTGSILWSKLYQTMQWSACFLMGCLFARWDLLSRVKAKLAGHYLACLASLLCLAGLVCLCFKLGAGMRYDFLWAPIVCLCLATLATTGLGARLAKPLEAIGKHSTNIWLTHSFFCYHWCQGFIYLPKWSPLVFLLLLGVSYALSLAIDWAWKWITEGIRQLDTKLYRKPVR